MVCAWSRLLPIFLLLVQLANAQETGISTEVQVYPTGIIPGLRIDHSIGEHTFAHLRLGYQFIDHRDLGEQDEESGTGYGFTLGIARFFSERANKWFWALRNDFWFNTIDWRNDSLATVGTTKITVVQPTAQLGYLHRFAEKWFLEPALSIGYEVNVRTRGEPTGEGAILLVGVRLGHWIN